MSGRVREQIACGAINIAYSAIYSAITDQNIATLVKISANKISTPIELTVNKISTPIKISPHIQISRKDVAF